MPYPDYLWQHTNVKTLLINFMLQNLGPYPYIIKNT